MKKHNTCIFFVTGMVLLACISGIVLADRNPPQTFETQGILITTSVDLDRAPRMVTELKEEEEMIWQQSNRALNGSPLQSPWPGFVSSLYLLVPFLGPEFDPIMDPLPGEVQYTVVHTENTQALNGASTSYEKTSTIDTQNRGPGQNNVQVSRNIQFSGGVDGRITSQEKLVVDGAGTFGKGEDSVLCPLSSFGGTHVIPPLESDPDGEFMIVEEDYIPPFCNIVQAASNLDMSAVSLVTSAAERHVAATSDYPVTLGYSIRAIGVDNGPASGTITASMNVHTQDGRMQFLGNVPLEPVGSIDIYQGSLGSEMTYVETTTATGLIREFAKSMDYQSGVARI
jgi:hypothetical protein